MTSGAFSTELLWRKSFRLVRNLSFTALVNNMGARLNDVTLDVRDPGDFDFFNKNGYSWDYIIVFRVFSQTDEANQYQKDHSMKKIVRKLAASGLETKMFYSMQNDEVYCKIRASVERLQKEADRIDYNLLLCPKQLRKMAERGVPDHGIEPIRLENERGVTKREPYTHIYAQYDMDPRLQTLYQRSEGLDHPFAMTHRLKLMLSIMEAHKNNGGAALNMTELVRLDALLAFYPLHDRECLDEIYKGWVTYFALPWKQPLWEIKSYFGEKIGMYFAWLGHYTTWLIAPSFFGVIAWIHLMSEGNNPNASSVPYFAGFMAVWSTVYLEYWKRRQATLAMEWGMTGFEATEGIRPEFIGESVKDPVTGKAMMWMDPTVRACKMGKSQVIVTCFVVMVIAAVSSIFWLRHFLMSGGREKSVALNGSPLGATIAGIANAIQIQVMGAIYNGVAIKLNDYENHRTDTMYEDNLIAKNFMFQFVNSYAALIYIAFVKAYIGDHCDPTCMSELATQLGTIFLTRLVTGNIMEILVPKLLAWKRARDERKGVQTPREPSRAEVEFAMAPYDEMMGTFGDYLEMILQFGYVTLFVSAFPLAPLLALVNNYVEIRVDGYNLVKQSRRPRPTSTEDIGTWYSILEIMATIAVVSNTAIVCFTGTFLEGYSDRGRVWVFIGIEHGIIAMKYVLALLLEDVPQDVTVQLERQEYLNEKLIKLVADDDDEELAKGNRLKEDFTIHDADDVF